MDITKEVSSKIEDVNKKADVAIEKKTNPSLTEDSKETGIDMLNYYLSTIKASHDDKVHKKLDEINQTISEIIEVQKTVKQNLEENNTKLKKILNK